MDRPCVSVIQCVFRGENNRTRTGINYIGFHGGHQLFSSAESFSMCLYWSLVTLQFWLLYQPVCMYVHLYLILSVLLVSLSFHISLCQSVHHPVCPCLCPPIGLSVDLSSSQSIRLTVYHDHILQYSRNALICYFQNILYISQVKHIVVLKHTSSQARRDTCVF